MAGSDGERNYNDMVGVNSPRNTVIQIGVSVALGIGAFLAFCVRTAANEGVLED